MSEVTEGERIFFERLRGGVFVISEDGVVSRVKRKSRKPGVTAWRDSTPKPYTRVGSRGYIEITIKVGTVDYAFSAHRVVYQYFFGEIPEGYVINHQNGVKTDNRPANLEVVTQQENAVHAVNVLGYGRGELNGNSKLDDDKVRDIRARYRKGNGQALADEFGVTCSLINQVAKRTIWKHVS